MDKGHAIVQRRVDLGTVMLRAPKRIEQIPVPRGQSGCPKCSSLILYFTEAVVVNARLIGGLGIAGFATCGKDGCDWQSEAMVRPPSPQDFSIQSAAAPESEIIGKPQIVRDLPAPPAVCPQCRDVVEVVQVALRDDRFAKKRGLGVYAVCPSAACHWQSPMMVVPAG